MLTTTLVPALAILGAVAAAPTPQPVKSHKLSFGQAQAQLHHPDPATRLAARDRSARRANAKYGRQHVAKRELATNTSLTDLVGDGVDDGYLVEMQIGTPPQKFQIIFDSGSSDLFVKWHCEGDDCDAPLTHAYNNAASSTYQANSTDFEFDYGSGETTGQMAADAVSVGSIIYPSFNFGMANQTQGFANCDGLMGMAFQSLSVENNIPFWQGVDRAGHEDIAFALRLARYEDSVSWTENGTISPGGEVTIGAYDPQYVGNGKINFVPMSEAGQQTGFWQIPFNSYTINGVKVPLQPASKDAPKVEAIIDSGTSLLYGPLADVQNIYKHVPGAVDVSGGQGAAWEYPCNADFKLSLNFGFQDIVISEKDLNLGPVDSTGKTCAGSIMAGGLQSWLLGDTLLKNVYSIFRGGNSPAVAFVGQF